MYLGNSRLLLGKTTNQKMLGDWLAIAPSTASSGTYGIDTGVGYCSEIFNGYLYVGGDISTLINNTSQTTSLNSLIKYNLQVTSSTWENALTTSVSTVYGIRSIIDGDHLLVAHNGGLGYLDTVSDTTLTSVESTDPCLGLSNTFTNFSFKTTVYDSNSTNGLCVAAQFYDDFQNRVLLYDGDDHSINLLNFSNTIVPLDAYYVPTANNFGIIFGIYNDGSFRFSKSAVNDFKTFSPSQNNVDPNLGGGEYFQCMISIPAYPNKIFIAGGGTTNKIYVYNYGLGEDKFDPPIDLGVTIEPITLNTVVYNDINYLIVGGREGIIIVDPEDTSVVKEVPIPDDDADIRSISVDSDSTIYVTGNFSFTDKNGVTAKNVAKFVPDASKLP